jgi:hypothetical protein
MAHAANTLVLELSPTQRCLAVSHEAQASVSVTVAIGSGVMLGLTFVEELLSGRDL